ncbi:MAG: CBS domain-containing protein [Erythrobacter sp.]|uniref:CBS domain-containing protein n=1 Tax=Erythrobacter sp. TaxID=1042 RepID=UPI003C75C345
MTIAKIIASRAVSDIVSCDVTTRLSDAIETLATRRIGAMPVMRGDSVAGIVSERDVIYCLANKGRECLDLPVEAIMTSPAITVAPTTLIDEALSLMSRRRFRHFPVVENEALVGFISIGDIVKHRIDEVEHEAAAMRTYIQTG